MSDYASRSVNHIRCHIGILPDEILSAIQLIATDAQVGDERRYRFPSTLCWISRHWRCVALDTPRIWSFIFISNAHTVECLEARLEKTGVVPLDIKIIDPKNLLDHNKVMKTLLTVHSRWLSFNLNTVRVENFAAHFPESLPILEGITFMDAFIKFKFTTSLPKLKYMTLYSSPLFWDLSVTFAHLVEFHVISSNWHRVAAEKMLHHLRNWPNLEVLDLSSSWALRTVPVEESEALCSQKVLLPRLRSMALEYVYPWEFAMMLSWIRAPMLQSLTAMVVKPDADVYLPDSPSVHQIQLNFPSLQKLTLIDMDLLGDEIRHILLQLPKLPKLGLISTTESSMDLILKIILSEPALAGIGGVHICGIPMANIYGCLSDPSVPKGPHALISQSKWKIHCDLTYQKKLTVEEKRFLTELRVLAPTLEVEYERLGWD